MLDPLSLSLCLSPATGRTGVGVAKGGGGATVAAGTKALLLPPPTPESAADPNDPAVLGLLIAFKMEVAAPVLPDDEGEVIGAGTAAAAGGTAMAGGATLIPLAQPLALLPSPRGPVSRDGGGLLPHAAEGPLLALELALGPWSLPSGVSQLGFQAFLGWWSRSLLVLPLLVLRVNS